MIRKSALGALVSTLIVSAAWWPLSPTAVADEATHREAVETLFNVLNMAEAHNRGMEQVLAIQAKQNPQAGIFEEAQRNFFQKQMSWESLKDEFVAVFMDEFSEEEIRELTAFYNTPTGQMTIKKMPTLMSRGARLQDKILRENMPELERMIKKEDKRLKKMRKREERSSKSRK